MGGEQSPGNLSEILKRFMEKSLMEFFEALKIASVGDDLIIHAPDGSVEYILTLKAKEERGEG